MTGLVGTEIIYVNPLQPNGQPGATLEQTTTGAIAALASTESAPFISTPITTVGNGTLTAAGLVGGQIVRTGPTSAFSDTTDSAANIVAAVPGFLAGETFSILIKNGTAFPQTIVAGAGVTLPATVIVPAFTVANYICTINTATTVTWIHIDTTPICIGANLTVPAETNISTVGAGTLTAAAFAGSLIQRTGAQSSTPFTDTTDIAANILAACGNLVNKIGTSMLVYYLNQTNANATITGGTGVTVSGLTIIPANSWGLYLVTYTAAATITMVGVALGTNLESLPPLNTAISTVGAGTLTAAGIVGGIITRTGSTSAFTDTTDIAANIIAALPNSQIGQSFMVTYENKTVAAATITGGTGVTVSGITLVPSGSWATYLVTYTAAGTITMVGYASGFLTAAATTFTANGATPVTVANAAVTADSQILITLKTVGGTVGTSCPNVRTITPGTGFTVAGIALDTSVYNYRIVG